MNYLMYTWHHFTPHGRYELNKLASLPVSGFIAQLVEYRTGIAEVTGLNPVEALIFSGFFFPILLKLENFLRWSFLTLSQLIVTHTQNTSLVYSQPVSTTWYATHCTCTNMITNSHHTTWNNKQIKAKSWGSWIEDTMTSKTHLFKNAMCVYAPKLICSMGVLSFQTFKRLFCMYSELRLHAAILS